MSRRSTLMMIFPFEDYLSGLVKDLLLTPRYAGRFGKAVAYPEAQAVWCLWVNTLPLSRLTSRCCPSSPHREHAVAVMGEFKIGETGVESP